MLHFNIIENDTEVRNDHVISVAFLRALHDGDSSIWWMYLVAGLRVSLKVS